MLDAALTTVVVLLVMAGYAIAIFLIALAWRVLADWADERLPRRRRRVVRLVLDDVAVRREIREMPLRPRRLS